MKFAATLPAVAAGLFVSKTNSTLTINDKIQVGSYEASGDNLESLLNSGNPNGCHSAPAGATSVTVHGCAVKVVAHLLTECGKYGKYSSEIGHCNCGNSAAASAELTSG